MHSRNSGSTEAGVIRSGEEGDDCFLSFRPSSIFLL